MNDILCKLVFSKLGLEFIFLQKILEIKVKLYSPFANIILTYGLSLCYANKEVQTGYDG